MQFQASTLQSELTGDLRSSEPLNEQAFDQPPRLRGRHVRTERGLAFGVLNPKVGDVLRVRGFTGQTSATLLLILFPRPVRQEWSPACDEV